MSNPLNLFIKSEQLGIVELTIDDTFAEPIKRKRQVKYRELVLLLKLVKLIPKEATVAGIGKGLNALGEPGYWIALENYTSIKAQGPQGEANG